MVEELERAALGVMYADGIVLVADSGDGVADYVGWFKHV